jgi:transposase-like protein
MSDTVIALAITVAIIALFFVWVPLLNLVCPPCGRFLERRRLQKTVAKDSSPMGVVGHKTS